MNPDRYLNSEWKNIRAVVDHHLCTQCGTCVAACPHHTIRMTRNSSWCFVPQVEDPSYCETCDRHCLAACAGVHEDPALWSRGPRTCPDYDQFCAGQIRSTWIGHSTDPHIRYRGASGGVVVGLLVHLLETGRIHGALIVGRHRSDLYQHEIKIARTRSEIEASCGSKYYPMPMGTRFNDLAVPGQRFAVVLLGCQMRSLRLLEASRPALRRSIVLRVGLICGYCAGFKALVDQAHAWRIKDLKSIQDIHFREGTWPGQVGIHTEDADYHTIIYDFLLRIPFTTHLRCLTCSDLMNETADLTVGDAWLRDLTARRDHGWSVVAARTARAQALVMRAQRDGALHVESIDRKTFLRSQEKPLRYKKDALLIRRRMVKRLLGTGIPDYDVHRYHTGFRTNAWNRLGNCLLVLTAYVFSPRDRLRRWVFRCVPRALLHGYAKSIFRMIAHDGRSSFLLKWWRRREPVLNCDA